jgi:hypothetical protein
MRGEKLHQEASACWQVIEVHSPCPAVLSLRRRNLEIRAVAAETKEIKAAGPVSRILSAALLLLDDHSSGPGIAARL